MTFPLQPGTYWIYRGLVKWQEGGGAAEETVTWTMEVVRSMDVGRYEVAFLEGHPNDLMWYRPGKPRGAHLLVRDDNKYYLARQQVDAGSEPDIPFVESQISFTNLVLSLPLQEGANFGSDPAFKRDDAMYAWSVQEQKQVQLGSVKGISPEKRFEEYALAYRTLPDHQFVGFAPGVGFTSFVYGHHGTLSEVDMKLVEFHPGQQATPPLK